jgi:hypothetical protein
MTQWWLLFKMFVMSMLPMPINPKLTRPNPKKNFWTFTCDEWRSPYQLAVMYYVDSNSA